MVIAITVTLFLSPKDGRQGCGDPKVRFAAKMLKLVRGVGNRIGLVRQQTAKPSIPFKELTMGTYPCITVLLRIFLMVPVIEATGECSFSALDYLQNYLRSATGDMRLNSICIEIVTSNSTMTTPLTNSPRTTVACLSLEHRYFVAHA